MSDALERAAGGPAWRRWVAWFGGAVLGLVLLIAAWGKALDPANFAEQIELEGLAFILSAPTLAWLVVVAEVVLGVALVVGLRTRAVLVSTGFLIVVFLFLTSRAYWRWAHGIDLGGSECGCFGNLVSRTPAEAFWQDLLLLTPTFAVCFLDEVKSKFTRRLGRWSVVALAGIAAGGFTLKAPELPIDDLATRLSPGVEIEGICAGSQSDDSERVCLDLLVPEVAAGTHLVMIDELDSEDLRAGIDRLNALTGYDGVWLLTDASEEDIQVFFWEWGPMFEVREVPIALLRPLYRTLPRSFSVTDGVVVETWAGLPEFDEGPERL